MQQQPGDSCYSPGKITPNIPCHPSVMGHGKCAGDIIKSDATNVNGYPTYCQPITHMDVENIDLSNMRTGGPILHERENHYSSQLQLPMDNDDDTRFGKLVESVYQSRHELDKLSAWRNLTPCAGMDGQEEACNSARMILDSKDAQRCQYDQNSDTCEPSLLSIQSRLDDLNKEIRTQKSEIRKSISQLNRIYVARYENIPNSSDDPAKHIATLIEKAQRDVLFQRCAIIDQYKSSMECVTATDSTGKEARIPFFCENLSGKQAECENDMRCTYMNTLCIPKSAVTINSINDRDIRKMICTTIPGRVWKDSSGACWEIKELLVRLGDTIQQTLKAGGNSPTQSVGSNGKYRNMHYNHFVEKLALLLNSQVISRTLRDIVREYVLPESGK